MTKTSETISKIAARATAQKVGEYDYPIADAFQLAYTLRGETKRRAIKILRALQDAQRTVKAIEELQTYTHKQLCACWELRTYPESWFPASFIARRRALSA